MNWKNTLSAFVLALIAANASAAKNPALEEMQTGKSRIAPATLNLAEYTAWAAPILGPNDSVSAFTEKAFAWLEEERSRGLPQQVNTDREKIYADTQGPRRETEEMEDAGEIAENVTVGANVYAEMDGSVEQVLEAMLFRWGKPVGASEGSTKPNPKPFSVRTEHFAPNPEWGSNAFVNQSIRQKGGVVNDMNDRYLMLLRGNASDGYEVLMQFVKRGGESDTTQSLGVAIIRPLGNGKTAYKIFTRYMGQNYGFLGGMIGKGQFGFNQGNVRGVQLDFMRQLKELKEKGKITN